MPRSHNDALNGRVAPAPSNSVGGLNAQHSAPHSAHPIGGASLPPAGYTPPGCWAGFKQTPHLRCLLLSVLTVLSLLVTIVFEFAVDDENTAKIMFQIVFYCFIVGFYIGYGLECTRFGDRCGTTMVERADSHELLKQYTQYVNQQSTP